MAHKSLLAAAFAAVVAIVVTGVAAGASTTGNAWAWGMNADGELGNGSVSPYSGLSTPGQVANLTGVVSVAGGEEHSLALRSDGTVWAWGNDGWGQLGNGGYTRSLTPIQVSGLTKVMSIAAGDKHNLAVKSDGTVWAWGFNYYGQVRIGPSGDRGNVLSPVQVTGLTGVVAVAAGGDTSFALKSDRTVWAWGYDGQGQLGNGTSNENPHGTPTKVNRLSTAVAIGAGVSHALAVLADGRVAAWGDNQTSELGATTTSKCSVYQSPCSPVPVLVAGLSGVKAVAGGYGNSLALKSDGTAWGWGSDGYGELGNGQAQLFGGVKNPVKALVQNVVAIAAGASFSLWLRSDGTVWAAGSNDVGQLGDGTFTDSVALVQVKLSGVFAIATGHSHALALRTP
jgi:alpha-tubulin suppressor-like RCC1 family protein